MTDLTPTSASFQLRLIPVVDEESYYHIKNAPGGQIERKHLSDSGNTLIVQADMAEVIHGRFSADKSSRPCTLLILDFRFLPTKLSRRFCWAQIGLQFYDPDGTGIDPEVLKIAPHGHFSMQRTSSTVEIKHSTDTSVQAGYQPLASATLGYHWELSKTVERSDATALVGAIRFVERDWGDKNGVEWEMLENQTTKTGIPTFFRTAVLLGRQRNEKGVERKFEAKVKINVEVDWLSKMGYAIQRMFAEKDDPVTFDPEKKKTNARYDEKDLGSIKLDDISSVVSNLDLSGSDKGG